MSEVVEVGLSNGAALLVRVEQVEADDEGPSDVGLREALSFKHVASALRGVATEVHEAFQAVKPDVVEVEFGMELGLQGSRVLAMLVDAGSKASINVRLQWHGKGETETDETEAPEE